MITTGLHVEPSRIPGLGAFFIVYKGGSIVEKPEHRGVSHLAEHLKFKAVDHLTTKMDSNAVDYNAYSGDEEVVFFLSGLDEKVDEFVGDFLKVIDYIPTEEEFQNEKNIVLQEMNIAFASKEFLFENIGRKFFNYFSAIGDRKVIEELTYESFVDFIDKNMHYPTAIIKLGSGVEIEKHRDTLKFSEVPAIKDLEISFSKDTNELSSQRFPDSAFIADWMMVGDDIVPFIHLEFIQLMWVYGLKSPLCDEIREKRGLTYNVGMHLTRSATYNISYFFCECNSDKIEEVRRVAAETFADVEKHITRERFETVSNLIRCTLKKSELSNFNSVKRFVDRDNMLAEDIDAMDFDDIYRKAVYLSKRSFVKASVSSELELENPWGGSDENQ